MDEKAKISVVHYHRGLRKVDLRDDANFVTLRIENGKMIDYLILPKQGYDLARDVEKPCRKWNELPMTV